MPSLVRASQCGTGQQWSNEAAAASSAGAGADLGEPARFDYRAARVPPHGPPAMRGGWREGRPGDGALENGPGRTDDSNALKSGAETRRRVVVAMSGGVDSSVVAALLHRAGHDVIGITCSSTTGAAMGRKGSCCAGQDIHDARRVAAALGIPHYVLDYEARFAATVMGQFADSYAAGETPVPCVACNQQIKFGDLLQTARELGADVLATGITSSGATVRRPRALPRRRCRARPELFPVRHDTRAAGEPLVSHRRPAQGGGARARARARPARRRQGR